jgi:hypothetical protein
MGRQRTCGGSFFQGSREDVQRYGRRLQRFRFICRENSSNQVAAGTNRLSPIGPLIPGLLELDHLARSQTSNLQEHRDHFPLEPAPEHSSIQTGHDEVESGGATCEVDVHRLNGGVLQPEGDRNGLVGMDLLRCFNPGTEGNGSGGAHMRFGPSSFERGIVTSSVERRRLRRGEQWVECRAMLRVRFASPSSTESPGDGRSPCPGYSVDEWSDLSRPYLVAVTAPSSSWMLFSGLKMNVLLSELPPQRIPTRWFVPSFLI